MVTEAFRSLGPKFAEPRQVQTQLLDQLMVDRPTISLVEAPTGIGKSPLALAYGALLEARQTMVLTATISLQEQYARDFDVQVFKGRGNFLCTENGLPADCGACISNPELAQRAAPDPPCDSDYYPMRRAVDHSPRVVANYAVYLNTLWYGKPPKPELLVCDEGHRLLDVLTEFEKVKLDGTLVNRLGLPGGYWPDLDSAVRWCGEWSDIIHETANKAVARADKSARQWLQLARQVDSLEAANKRDDLLTLKVGESIEVSPLWPRIAAKRLFRGLKYVLIMSATLYGGHILADLLGLEDTSHGKSYAYYTAPSPFDPRRWPVYYRPVAALNHQSGDGEWGAMSEAVHQYVHNYREVKGVIHVSAANQVGRILDAAYRCGDCKTRVLAPERGVARHDLLQQYRLSPPGVWLAHYCLGPNTRILYTDGSWRLLRDAQVGDELIGFDEHPPKSGGWRKLRRSTIDELTKVRASTYIIQTDKGETTASANHMWLASYPKKRWIRTAALRIGHRIRFIGTWDYNADPYLGGLLDGEGYIRGGLDHEGAGIGFGQKPGVVLEAYKQHLEHHGIRYTTGVVHDDVKYVVVGRFPERLKLLSIAPSLRLREHQTLLWEGKRAASAHYATVRAILPLGSQELIGLKTSTATLFADGMFSHNSVGEGESFDDDAARIQLIAKCPYPDLGEKLTRLRQQEPGLGKKLYAAMTLNRIAQIAGRVMRHDGDYGETVILDGSFRRLWSWHKDLAPAWFNGILVP